ncbi:MAG: DUF1553 domain-containing protein [Planctomycetes bacterium]|nr:DUF1553 domain-containing protein [Planctomycetota bacterium]
MKSFCARAAWLSTLSIAVFCPASRGDEASAEALEFFEKKVRPVLAEHCYRCHSEQTKRPKGGLRLDSLDALLKGGDNGPALLPSKPDKSRLLEAVTYRNVDLQMPPKGKLPDSVIADLAQWIKLGAPWPKEKPGQVAASKYEFDLHKRKREHWAWRALQAPAIPAVKDAAWPVDPLDRFILAGLEAKGLTPAPAAEPRAILRRLYFDIIGLPPTPDEVASFEKAAKGNLQSAVEATVDRLLASPRYGERWGRHWLDLVRYGESRGHEFDYVNPNAYQYRDYVIRAFNADVPYDRFTVEHIAGDLLARPRLNPEREFNESILGTGFWHLGEQVHSPVDICQDKADRFDNMIDVLSKTFLGLTVSCARCHDHKFDAISTKDYYALAGFLESSSYRLVRFDTLEQERRLAEEMQDVRERGRARLQKALADSCRPTSAKLADYLMAARTAMLTGVETAAGTAEVFEDFESGTYAGWEVTGTAFGKKPQTLATIAAYQGKINAVGKFFVNSHNIRDREDVGRGDAHKGTMTSRPFTISRPYITMLVGGGAHDGTCVRLLIDGKAVRTASGHNDNQMFPVRWDVRRLRGKTARIQIVDDVAGGWGNIGVDHIVFTDRGDDSATPAPAFSEAFRRRVEQIARDRKLDPTILTRWVAYLAGPAGDASQPFHRWAKACRDKAAKLSDAKPGPRSVPASQSEVIVDYANPGMEGWLPDGFAFGLRPVRVGEVVGQSSIRFADRAAAVSDPAFARLRLAAGSENDPGALGGPARAGRTIRTPTFAVKSGRVHYLVKGAGRAYAAVEAHVMISGPLHGQLMRSFKTGSGFQWQSHDLTAYQGRRAHIEFTPAEGAELAIAMVVQGEQPPPLPQSDSLASSLAASPPASIDALAKTYQSLLEDVITRLTTDSAADASWRNWLVDHAELLGAEEAVAGVGKEVAAIHARLTGGAALASRLALAMQDGNGVNERVFIRGTYKAPGEPAPRRLLEALAGPEPLAMKRGSGRLELARQIVDPKIDPFLPRVMANRVWHHLFGKGIVGSVDNFGYLGERPTHPELLDHLATRLIEDGWSIKKLIRRVATSHSYQMSIREDVRLAKLDPENRLWQHRRLRRLEGEAIRDAMLSVSGRLDLRMYGPAVPVHLTEFQDGRGRPSSGPLDGDGRRSVYLAVRRNFLSSFLLAFDAPIPFCTVGRRTVSNVPAQALILMNDPFVHQQAETWARRVLAMPATAQKRIESMYRSALSRGPTADEATACLEFLRMRQASASEVAAWTALAHVLYNAKEFIYLE